MVVHQNITNLAGYFHFLNVRKIPYVIRESILRNLGWNIVRVWSTDWFMNSKEALERINNELLELHQPEPD